MYCISAVVVVTANLITSDVKMLFAYPLQTRSKDVTCLEWVNVFYKCMESIFTSQLIDIKVCAEELFPINLIFLDI